MTRRSMLSWALAGVLGPPALLWLVGSFLPREHVAHAEARFDAEAPTVWSFVAAPENGASWRSSVDSVERLPDRAGRACYREDGSFGPMVYTVEEIEEGRRLVTRIVDRTDFGGTWEFRLSAQNGGTLLAITERGTVESPIFRALGRYVFGFESTLRRYLEDLRRELEPEH